MKVAKYMLQRTKKETIKERLPTKKDNIVFCRMSEYQTRAYERFRVRCRYVWRQNYKRAVSERETVTSLFVRVK